MSQERDFDQMIAHPQTGRERRLSKLITRIDALNYQLDLCRVPRAKPQGGNFADRLNQLIAKIDQSGFITFFKPVDTATLRLNPPKSIVSQQDWTRQPPTGEFSNRGSSALFDKLCKAAWIRVSWHQSKPRIEEEERHASTLRTIKIVVQSAGQLFPDLDTKQVSNFDLRQVTKIAGEQLLKASQNKLLPEQRVLLTAADLAFRCSFGLTDKDDKTTRGTMLLPELAVRYIDLARQRVRFPDGQKWFKHHQSTIRYSTAVLRAYQKIYRDAQDRLTTNELVKALQQCEEIERIHSKASSSKS